MIFDIKNDMDVQFLREAIKDKQIGLTSGSFDLFHHLHLVYLQNCRRFCDILIVGVDSNSLVTKRKGPDRPLVAEYQRVAIVSALSCVHAVFVMGTENDFGVAVHLLRPSYIFKNQAFTNQPVLGDDQAQVIIIPDIKPHTSTSQIIEEIRNRRTAPSA